MVFSIIMALFTVYIEYFMSSEVRVNSHEMEIHIPSIQGEFIPHMAIAGVPISNTVFSMWLFMVILFIAVGFLFAAIKTRAFPRLRNMGIDLMKRIDDFFYHSLQDKKTARTFFPLVGGFFVYIFLSNIFWLGLDWVNFVLEGAHTYLRPINSDLNTTVVMAVTIILVSQITAIKNKGFFVHFW